MITNTRTSLLFLVLSIVLLTHFPGAHQQTTQSTTTESREVTTQEKITEVVEAPTTTPIQEGRLFNTEMGDIRGEEELYNGENVFMFRGIPYAKPPVGERRFQYPEAYNMWDDTPVKALNFGPRCVQPMEPDIHMSEDCLHLNVYTRTVSTSVSGPVAVLFNNGGWTRGSAEMMHAMAMKIASENIVVVTLNHRVGPFGFLSTEDSNAPGSYGLMDQVEALRWVQKNIYLFGGNNQSVTLYGEGSGGHAVTLHMTSPESRDLFHAGIAVNGVAPFSGMVWNNPPSHNLQLAQELAENLKCTTDKNKDMMKCLRKRDWDTLNEKTPKRDGPKPTWRVRVDGKFLEEGPDKVWSEERFAKVPFIAMSSLIEATGGSLTKEEFKTKVLGELLKGTYGDATDAMYNAIEFEYTEYSLRNVSNADRELNFIRIKNDMNVASVVKTLRTAAMADGSASLHWAVGDIVDDDKTRTIQQLARTGGVDKFRQDFPLQWHAFTADKEYYIYVTSGFPVPSANRYRPKQMAFWDTHRQNVVDSVTEAQWKVTPKPTTTTTTEETQTTAPVDDGKVSYDYFIATWVLLAILLLVLIILIIVICQKTSEKSYDFEK